VKTFSFLVVVGLSGVCTTIHKPARDEPNTNFTATSSNGDYVDLCQPLADSSHAQDGDKIIAGENGARYFQFPGASRTASMITAGHVDGARKTVSNLSGKVCGESRIATSRFVTTDAVDGKVSSMSIALLVRNGSRNGISSTGDHPA